MDFPGALSRLGDAGAGGPAGRQQSHLRLAGNVGRAGVPSIAYVRRLRRTLARLAPDLIHSNGFKMHVLAAWALGGMSVDSAHPRLRQRAAIDVAADPRECESMHGGDC